MKKKISNSQKNIDKLIENIDEANSVLLQMIKSEQKKKNWNCFKMLQFPKLQVK